MTALEAGTAQMWVDLIHGMVRKQREDAAAGLLPTNTTHTTTDGNLSD